MPRAAMRKLLQMLDFTGVKRAFTQRDFALVAGEATRWSSAFFLKLKVRSLRLREVGIELLQVRLNI